MALGPTQLPVGRGLLPTELTGMWGWILLRSPHRGRGSPPAAATTKQRPGSHASLPALPSLPLAGCAPTGGGGGP